MLREEYVTVREAAKEINFPGVSYELILKFCRAGMHYVKPGRTIFVRISDVEDCVKNNTLKQKPASKNTRINDSIKRLKKRRIG